MRDIFVFPLRSPQQANAASQSGKKGFKTTSGGYFEAAANFVMELVNDGEVFD